MSFELYQILFLNIYWVNSTVFVWFNASVIIVDETLKFLDLSNYASYLVYVSLKISQEHTSDFNMATTGFIHSLQPRLN